MAAQPADPQAHRSSLSGYISSAAIHTDDPGEGRHLYGKIAAQTKGSLERQPDMSETSVRVGALVSHVKIP